MESGQGDLRLGSFRGESPGVLHVSGPVAERHSGLWWVRQVHRQHQLLQGQTQLVSHLSLSVREEGLERGEDQFGPSRRLVPSADRS